MPKGKKFNAAEKHFLEKELKYKSHISRLQEQHIEDLKRIVELEKQKHTAETKNAELQDWIERLLQYTELSKEDIKEAVESDKALGDMSKTFNQLLKVTRMF